jgi:hypothetical protein
MPQPPALTNDQVAEFEREGVLRLDGLLPSDRVARARTAILRPLDELGLWRDGAWRLDDRPRPVWPATGLKTARDIGHRHPEVEALIDEPALAGVVDLLLGGRPYDREVYPRPQVLFSLPNAGPWTLPAGWHTDCPRLASGERVGVQLFTFLDAVEPRGGAPLVVAGSHLLLNDGRAHRLQAVNRELRREPFFRDLFLGRVSTPNLRDTTPMGRVADVRLKVAELTGRPGDVWLMDPRILHAAAPNASDRPRLMVTHRFLRADLMPEISAAFGWT